MYAKRAGRLSEGPKGLSVWKTRFGCGGSKSRVKQAFWTIHLKSKCLKMDQRRYVFAPCVRITGESTTVSKGFEAFLDAVP